MPRIYTSRNDPIDFCRRCFPSEKASQQYANLGDVSDGSGRGNCFEYDAEHPDYDGEEYTCDKCGKLLTSEDNYV